MVTTAVSTRPASSEAPAVPVSPELPAISEARLRANRANARKSTGPRTPEGKARASQNALVHGLRSASILSPGDDPHELIEYRISMIRATNPLNAIEMEYVEQVIRAGWKLRRYQAAEINALSFAANKVKKMGPKRTPPSGALLACLLWEQKPFQALPRYELQYTRMMNRALSELRKLKTDPIYENQANFAAEIIEAEEGQLHEMETTECPEEEHETGIAPNEPKPQEQGLTAEQLAFYEARLARKMDEISALETPEEVLEMCRRSFADEPEPNPAS